MSMQNYLEALEIIKARPDKAFFVGERSEEIVRSAEARLGITFPPIYRLFLRSLGAGNFGSAEFYGITTSNFDSASVPNGVWFTVSERQDIGLPSALVVIGVSSYGELYCIDTAHNPDGPIVVYQSHLGPTEQHSSESKLGPPTV